MKASDEVTNYIAGLEGWRGEMMKQLRQWIREAAPDASEEWKWRTPVWSQNGNLVALGAFQDHVKVNFFRGASLSDPHGLFNAGLDAKATRAIDLHEGDRLNAAAFQGLVRAAVALNSGAVTAKKTRGKAS